jgi:hypothetical protein
MGSGAGSNLHDADILTWFLEACTELRALLPKFAGLSPAYSLNREAD